MRINKRKSVFEADNDDFTLTLYNLNYGTNYATQLKQNGTQGDTQDDTQEEIIKMIEENPRVTTADMAKKLGIGMHILINGKLYLINQDYRRNFWKRK
jgi:predicted HTH transcriptional regulator